MTTSNRARVMIDTLNTHRKNAQLLADSMASGHEADSALERAMSRLGSNNTTSNAVDADAELENAMLRLRAEKR